MQRETLGTPVQDDGGESVPVLLSVAELLVEGGLIFLIMLSPFMWLLRDGLGPNSDPRSAGWQAVRRALDTFWWGRTFAILLLLKLLLFSVRKRMQDD